MLLCLSVKLILSTVLVLSGQCYSQRSNETDIKTINVIFMAPYPDLDPLGRPATFEDGHNITPAAYLAVEQINNRTDILKGYKLELIRKDEGCNVTDRTVDSLASYIYRRTAPLAGIIGLTCIEASEVIVQQTTSSRAGILSLAYFEPAFRDKPNAFGVIPIKLCFSELYFELMKANNWKHVAVMYSSNEKTEAERLSKKVIDVPDFEIVYKAEFNNDRIPLEELRGSFSKVVFVFATPDFYSRLFCLAYHQNMTHPDYQWIIAYGNLKFFETSFNYSGVNYHCSVEQIHKAIEGSLLFVSDLRGSDPDKVVTSGLNITQFRSLYSDQAEEYANMYNVTSMPSDWGIPAYDGTWALALALNSSLDELEERNVTFSEKDLSRQREITDVIRRHMLQVEFDGFTGYINFNTTECPVNQSKTTILLQYMENDTRKPIGTYQFGELNLTATVTFLNYNIQFEYNYLSTAIALPYIVLALIALLLTISAHFVNVLYRNHLSIKASSHKLNHIIFLGSYLVILGIVLHTFNEHLVLSLTAHTILCNTFPGFCNIGLTLILATVCMKTWRLYAIFKNEGMPKKKKVFKDKVMALIIGLFASVEIALIVVWMAYAPRKAKETRNLQVTESDSDGLEQSVPVVIIDISCHSNWTFPSLISLSIYKGSVLFLSLLFAILSRNIHRKEFETKNIIILVYLLSILFAIGAPVYLIVQLNSDSAPAHFLALTTSLILTVYICLGVLFLPPILPIIREKYRKGQEPQTFDLKEPRNSTLRANLRYQNTLQEYQRSLKRNTSHSN